ncbi:helix-turn-helix domain-containing protein, partial [Streptococcus suis]
MRRVQVYLLQARKEAGLTQAELANLLGISTTSYGDKER